MATDDDSAVQRPGAGVSRSGSHRFEAGRAIRLVRLLLVLTVWSMTAFGIRAGDTTVPLWPGDVPGEASLPESLQARIARDADKNTDDRVFAVSRPDLTVRLAPPESANGTAVLVCPGGGYNVLAWAKEGLEVADWLNSLGVHAFVLRYRVPRREPDHQTPPLQDAQRAMRLIRARADEWRVNPERVGVLGFSAGGHLSVTLATADDAAYARVDAADSEAFRPNFLIPVYAAYLGDPDDDQQLNPALTIDDTTPPAFLVVTQDDRQRGLHAALLFAELTRAGVPAEVHVFLRGGHGYGLRPSDHPVTGWPKQCGAWMKAMGYLNRP